MKQVGIPLFYLQGMGGGAVLKFRDLFNDSSLFWGWQLYLGETPAGKSGMEANGVYKLRINNTIHGVWMPGVGNNEAPRLWTGILTYPCEIITRLDEITRLENTGAGLFLAKSAIEVTEPNWFCIGQRSDATSEGVAVSKDGAAVVRTDITTLPMWLRIRIGCPSVTSVRAYFDYSIDGLNWVNLYELPEVGFYYFSFAPPCVGLFVNNWAAFWNMAEAKFDFFQMKPKSIN